MRAELRGAVAGLLWWAMAEAGPAKPHTEKEGYVGTEACVACHEDLGKSFLKTRHAPVETGRAWKGQACEACHGPGQKHGEAAEAKFILNFAKATPREADAPCLSCHRNQATHVGRIRGSHAKVQVACITCHSVHHAVPDPGLPLFRQPTASVTGSRASQVNQQCAGCHASAWAAFQRPHAHALPQGVMSCVDCHNPHGTSRPFGLNSTARTTNAEPGCFQCHSDKRGPFAFEHAPMRLEGCSACHESHGSSNPRMLIRSNVAQMCLECHSNLPATTNPSGTLGTVASGFHDLRLPVYRNCTTCHTRIHGSHISRDLLR